jgi:hypothetical protein
MEGQPQVLKRNEQLTHPPVRREEIDLVLDNPEHTAGQVRSAFESNFREFYTADAGTIERYTLGDHTFMVLKQFHRYFKDFHFSEPVSKKFFETIIALHDLGKPQAARDGDMSRQYEYTLALLNTILPELGYHDKEIAIARALVGGDPIRLYLYKRDVDINLIAADILKRAHEANMVIDDFWELMMLYWKCDAGSYTVNAGGKASLDRMFVFDTVANEMHLAPHIEERMVRLKEQIELASQNVTAPQNEVSR